MNLRRILKMVLAFLTGQGVAIVNQLLVPPLFIHRYAHGLETYGEWIALSAAVTYLSSLNSGIQNYANNQMTIHLNRNEMDEAKAVQASALIMILSLIALFTLASLAVLFLPVGHWLKLKYTNPSSASWALALLIQLFLMNWLFSMLANSFMAIGQLHRGTNWMNAQRLFSVLLLAVFLWNRASLPALALVQFGAMVLFTLLVMFDLRINAPALLPSLRYGSLAKIRSMIRPSAMFVLFAISGFLLWQGPVIIIQMTLGETALAIFSLTRVAFNMSRQLLVVLTFAIGQEITILIGSRDWKRLHRLYDLSERVVLALITTVSVGTLLLCPFLFTIWLHKGSIYNPTLCLLMAIISSVMAIKEHKTQFQQSSNQHQRLSIFALSAYVLMSILSAIMLPIYGVMSLLVIWLCVETAQVIYLLRLNKQLFPAEMHISIAPVIRTFVVLTICFVLCIWPVYHNANWPLTTTVAIGSAAIVCLSVLSYFFFGIRELQDRFTTRLRGRFAA
jgi:O-antigen/teichoic acid export membrane protein